MKKVVLIFLTVAVIVLLGKMISSHEYKETNEYEIVSSRVWEYKEESGVFTTKTNITTYVEIIYETDGNYEKINVKPYDIFIEPKTIVLCKKGNLTPRVYMTKDYYNSLFN